MSLRPGKLSFSQDRLRAIWRDPENQERGILELHPLVNHKTDHELPSLIKARELCLKLYDDTEVPVLHLARLDKRYSDTYWLADLGRATEIEQQIFERAKEILEQLPATSPTILGALPSQDPFEDSFLVAPPQFHHQSNLASRDVWETLLVVNHVDTVVLRLVLCIAQSEIARQHGPPRLVRLLNAAIYLLKVSLDLARDREDSDQRWSIVCAFLWTSWQRVLMLHLRSIMGRQLKGFDHNIRGLGSLRALEVVPEVFKYRRSVQQAELKATPYLCAWAYRNLAEDRACLSTDLRRFAQLHHACFGGKAAACNAGPEQCNGLSPVFCGRLEQTPVTNQSMHTRQCRGDCGRLFWCRDSFVAVSGPKAIDIDATNETDPHDCAVTEKTLIVSHVWSHGQGGRPDHSGPESTGFNACLHQRHTKIALLLGCSSYWIDTACVPNEEGLRKDCTADVASIFSLSNATLICDQDIMSIDIVDLSVEVCEKLLATLLVCDWNMRAWTSLEAMHGRSSLYLLCAGDKTVKLYDVLQRVFQYGRLDIVVLFSTRAYLLPPGDITELELPEDTGSVAAEQDRRLARGSIGISEAMVLLSHRHATRDEDDVLVWNLLVGNVERQDAAAMWKREVGKRISSGALISSAPRLQDIPGFGWAPSRPALPRRPESTPGVRATKTFVAYDYGDSKEGEITAGGLRAKWLTFRIPVPETGAAQQIGARENSEIVRNLNEIEQRYLANFVHGILLRVSAARGPRNLPLPYQGSDDHMLVVCGSHDGAGWEWRGIYGWERSCPLPSFIVEEVLLV